MQYKSSEEQTRAKYKPQNHLSTSGFLSACRSLVVTGKTLLEIFDAGLCQTILLPNKVIRFFAPTKYIRTCLN